MSASRKNYRTAPKKFDYKRKEGYKTPKVSMTNPKQLAQLAVEKKNLDFTAVLTPAGAGTWSQVATINIVNVGTGPTNRIGRKIKLKSLYLRYQVIPAADPAPAQGRILVVYDKQTNGALPLITDILVQNIFNSPNNLANADRFVTLVDCITALPNSAQNVSGSEYRKINLEQIFNPGVAGTVADINFGACFIMFMPSSGSVLNTATIFTRMRYSDI